MVEPPGIVDPPGMVEPPGIVDPPGSPGAGRGPSIFDPGGVTELDGRSAGAVQPPGPVVPELLGIVEPELFGLVVPELLEPVKSSTGGVLFVESAGVGSEPSTEG